MVFAIVALLVAALIGLWAAKPLIVAFCRPPSQNESKAQSDFVAIAGGTVFFLLIFGAIYVLSFVGRLILD